MIFVTIYALAFAVVSGCAATEPNYDVSFYNSGKTQLTEVRCLNVPELSAGVLIPGSWKNDSDCRFPVPEEMTMAWNGADGVYRERKLAVRQLIEQPGSFRGTILIRFTQDGPTVIPVPKERKYETPPAVSGS